MNVFAKTLAVPSDNEKRLKWLEISDAQRAELENAMIRRTHRSGEALFLEGEQCQGVHFVLSGAVGIRKTDIDGNSFLLHLANVGEPIGYQALLSGEDYSFEAEALAPSEVGFVPKAQFLNLLARAPEFAFQLLKQTASDLEDAERRSFELLTKPARARVVRLLWLLKDEYATKSQDGSTVMELPFTRKDMASLAGITPETISRVIRKLMDEGVAQFIDRTVRIPDWRRLDRNLEFEMAA